MRAERAPRHPSTNTHLQQPGTKELRLDDPLPTPNDDEDADHAGHRSTPPTRHQAHHPTTTTHPLPLGGSPRQI